MKRIAQIAMLVVLIMKGTLVFSAVAPTISYQGYLTDSSGIPVNGTVSMTFSLYTAVTGTAAPLWSETLAAVTVKNGMYNVTLGYPTPLNLSFDAPYFLGITVGSDTEMTPRTRLRSAPYAIRAATADNLASSVTTTAVVANLNAEMVGGKRAADFVSKEGDTMTGNLAAPVFVANAASGTAPLQVSSTTMVTNLNSNMLEGKSLSALDARYGASSAVLPPSTNTITTVDSTGNVGRYSSITIGTDGYPVISYYDYTNDTVKVLKCVNAACTSGSIITTVDSTGDLLQYSSIVVGTDGFPVISYYDWHISSLKTAKCGNPSCSLDNTITTVDSSANVGAFSSITIGTDGFPVLSYYDLNNNDLKVVKCGNVTCSSGNTVTTLDSSGMVGLYTAIAIGTDGYPVISYYDWTNYDLKVAKCGNNSCSAGATFASLDSPSTTGQYTALTIGTDGYPVISYYDSGNGDLRVAKCGNASCSSGNTLTTVDSSGNVGQHTSITIGTDGYPVISYYDVTNYDLKVAKCGNASCSSGNTIVTLDSSGDVGQYSAITIGTDGTPVVSYYDQTNGDLKVARCANPYCLNNWRRR